MNPNIVGKSEKIARAMFPAKYETRENYQAFHWCFAWKRNRMLAVGQNHVIQPDAAALRFAVRFGNQEQIEYPYLHAEIDMIDQLWGKYYIDSKMKVVVIRLNKDGELCNSKPCPSCHNSLSMLGVSRIWYSNGCGKIVRL